MSRPKSRARLSKKRQGLSTRGPPRSGIYFPDKLKLCLQLRILEDSSTNLMLQYLVPKFHLRFSVGSLLHSVYLRSLELEPFSASSPLLANTNLAPPTMERPSKRTKVSRDPLKEEESLASGISTPLASLQRSISPPARTRSGQPLALISACPEITGDQDNGFPANDTNSPRLIPSPFQLTHVQDLPDKVGFNIGTVKLRDILGDPMIKECWQFNYCFDVDFLMSKFDQDVKGLVKVKIVHGSWERESMNKIGIDVSMVNALT